MPSTSKNHIEYFILSRKKISLIRVVGSQAIEIEDENFPMLYTEEYEYAKSVLGSSFGYSMKGFEKDKSIMTEIRFISFLRSTDHRLKLYLKKNNLLILAGVKKGLMDFKKITKHGSKMVGEITGSYSEYNRNKLIKSSREVMMSSRFGMKLK